MGNATENSVDRVDAERVAALRSLLRSAIYLPWQMGQSRGYGDFDIAGAGGEDLSGTRGMFFGTENAELAVAAVNALPDLLEEVARLRAVLVGGTKLLAAARAALDTDNQLYPAWVHATDAWLAARSAAPTINAVVDAGEEGPGLTDWAALRAMTDQEIDACDCEDCAGEVDRG